MRLIEYRKISRQVEDALRAALLPFGLDPKPYRAGIDETLGTVRITLECRDVNHKAADGSATTPERELYRHHAETFGMKPEWLDQPFNVGLVVYQIVGLKARGAKCVLIKRKEDSRVYVDSPEHVIQCFAFKKVDERLAGGGR